MFIWPSEKLKAKIGKEAWKRAEKRYNDYCNKNNIAFNLLMPLIEETISRLHNYEPSAMQTGPAIRGDVKTMEKHLQMLNDFPQLKNIYSIMSESIKNKTAKQDPSQ